MRGERSCSGSKQTYMYVQRFFGLELAVGAVAAGKLNCCIISHWTVRGASREARTVNKHLLHPSPRRDETDGVCLIHNALTVRLYEPGDLGHCTFLHHHRHHTSIHPYIHPSILQPPPSPHPSIHPPSPKIHSFHHFLPPTPPLPPSPPHTHTPPTTRTVRPSSSLPPAGSHQSPFLFTPRTYLEPHTTHPRRSESRGVKLNQTLESASSRIISSPP